MLVLEELEHARERGAKIYAEVLGYGVSSDAAHVTEPDPTGSNPARAMKWPSRTRASRRRTSGTSTRTARRRLGDPAETRVLKTALGEEKACATPVSSTKGDRALPRRRWRRGGDLHRPRGAAGRPAADDQLREAGPECDLDYIPNEARPQRVEIGVSNSFGFGGHNVRRVPPLGRPGVAASRVRRATAARGEACPATPRRAARCAPPPHEAEPEALVKREAGRVLGNTLVWIVQRPAASAPAIRTSMSARPTPAPASPRRRTRSARRRRSSSRAPTSARARPSPRRGRRPRRGGARAGALGRTPPSSASPSRRSPRPSRCPLRRSPRPRPVRGRHGADLEHQGTD